MIYPSQRQNLPPILEIVIRNFSKFSIIFKIWKKFQNFEFFSQNFKNYKGAATDIKGAAASSLPNYKIFIFSRVSKARGI